MVDICPVLADNLVSRGYWVTLVGEAPADIDKKLRKGEYKKDKKDDIISKLNTAIDEAKEATRLFEARTGGNQRGDGSHRYRVILYQALVANSKDW